MIGMNAVHLTRTPPIRATGWFAVAVATTVAAAAIGAVVWAVTNAWLGVAGGLLVAAAVGAAADRRSHRNLAAYALGSVVTIVGLLAAPLVMAQVYVAALNG